MQQTHNEPLYWSKDRVPFNLTLVMALGIAGWGLAGLMGIITPPGSPEMIIILGVAVAAYTWLFTPRAYMVYADALCVAYGRPRVKVIHFSNIAVVEMGSLATMDQLRVRPVRGRRQSIRVREPEIFFDHLEAALNAYRDAHPEENIAFQVMGRGPAAEIAADEAAGVIEGEATPMVDAAESGTPAADSPDNAGNTNNSAAADNAPVDGVAEPITDTATDDAGPEPAPAEPEEPPPEPEHRPIY